MKNKIMTIDKLKAAMQRISDEAFDRWPTENLVPFFGPPVEQCELFIISLEPAGEDTRPHRPWPEYLLYANRKELDDKGGSFGPNLRYYMAEEELVELDGMGRAISGILYDRTMAMPVSPRSQSRSKRKNRITTEGKNQGGFAAIKEIIELVQPKVILATGPDSMRALVGDEDSWENKEQFLNGNNMATAYAESTFEGRPVVLCKHPSVIAGADCLMRKSMKRVKDWIKA